MAIKTSILPEFGKFLLNVGPDVPYHILAGAARDAGWFCVMRQGEVIVVPIDGSMLVTFSVHVARLEDLTTLEFFDSVTVRLPAGNGPVSLAARMQAESTLLYLFFGRLPPQPVQEVRAPAGEADIELPGEKPIAEPMNGTSEAEDRGLPGPVVVARHEPDGVPIFRDLYTMPGGHAGPVVVEAVLDEIDAFLVKAEAEEQVLALALKNPELIRFVQDLGTAAQVAELNEMVTRRRAALAPVVMAQAPRRRSSAGQ